MVIIKNRDFKQKPIEITDHSKETKLLLVTGRHIYDDYQLCCCISSFTSSIGSLLSAMATSSRPVDTVPSLRSCSAGLLFSSTVSDIGSIIDSAVSASAASEQENTSRLCRLQDSGRSEVSLYVTTAVHCQHTTYMWSVYCKVQKFKQLPEKQV